MCACILRCTEHIHKCLDEEVNTHVNSNKNSNMVIHSTYDTYVRMYIAWMQYIQCSNTIHDNYIAIHLNQSSSKNYNTVHMYAHTFLPTDFEYTKFINIIWLSSKADHTDLVLV